MGSVFLLQSDKIGIGEGHAGVPMKKCLPWIIVLPQDHGNNDFCLLQELVECQVSLDSD